MDDWNQFASQSPLATDWSSLFQEQVPSYGWWSDVKTPFGYSAENGLGQGFDYDPGSTGGMYAPASSMTNRIIDSDIDSYLRREFPEMYDFTSGSQTPGGVASVGNIATGDGFGQFDSTADAEILAAAKKYGVPANFLRSIIAAESSGDWASNNRAPYLASRNQRILPYVGVFEDAAKSWGFNFDALIGNRAGQIEMLASGLRGMYDKVQKMNPQYGWSNVASYHYSGYADPALNSWSDEAGNGSNTDYMNKVVGWWKDQDAFAGNTWSNYTSVGQNTGIASPQSPEWGKYAQWDQAILGLNVNSGAPSNLLKSLLRYGDESGFGYSNNFDTSFAPQVDVLAERFRQTGDWTTAIAITLGVPVTDTRVVRIKGYWDELNADASGMFGGPPGAQMPSNQVEAIWGGGLGNLTQEFGLTDFSQSQNGGMYDYATGLGLPFSSHAGLDYGMPVGTRLYVPVSGTVYRSGGTGYFFNDEGSKFQDGIGELRIRLDNGDELIMGHMSNISLKAGDRVAPGTFAGLSGYPSGPHLHLEYRTPSSSTSTGWQAVDPRTALGGAFTGYHQGAQTGLGYTTPLTFKNLMLAGASGQPIPTGAVYAQGGGNSAWTSWLRNAMMGTQSQEVRAGQIDYGNLYNTGAPGAT